MEKVEIKKAFTNLPNLATIEITGQVSAFKQGDQISLDEELELEKFESIVAFYNSSLTLFVSKITLFALVAICVFTNFKF